MRIHAPTLEAVAEQVGLVGRGRVFTQQLEGLGEAASSDAPLLVQGERGVQFQPYAHFVHLCSDRAHREYIPCDCSALTATQFEQKLLAYSNGCSYDQRDRPDGLLREGQSGTLYLNNIGALPEPATLKLVRLLQAGEYRPIGGRSAQPSDLRLILSVIFDDCSDNQGDGLKRCGRVLEDVGVRELWLSPLRERSDDVPDLLEHFAKRYADNTSCREGVRFERSAIEWLCAYPWPRNDQQLEELVVTLTGQGSSQVSMSMVRALLPPAVSRTIAIPRKAETVFNAEAEDALQQVEHPSENHREPIQEGSIASDLLLHDATESSDHSPMPTLTVVNSATCNPSETQSRNDSSQADVVGGRGAPFTLSDGERPGVTPRRRRCPTLIILAVAILLAALFGFLSRGWFSTAAPRDPQESDSEHDGIGGHLDKSLRLTDDYRFEDARQLPPMAV